MAGIIGILCESEQDLRKVAIERRKEYHEISVQNHEVQTYEMEGWQVVRVGKGKTRIRKPKKQDALFEDKIWMIFYNLGFSYLNKDRNCKLKFNSLTKQIDVIARDESNIFIVECKSSESDNIVKARDALEYWKGKLDDAQKSIKTEWGRYIGRINVVVAISSQDKREIDENYASEIRHKNIFFWSVREIDYIQSLIQQVGGASAKYQLYSVIFANKKQKNLQKTCPAIKAKIAGKVFYTFLISAKDLLKYAYVHHRDLTGIAETSLAYQRMLKKAKLNEIRSFVDKEGGYFPNSIIVNFSKEVRWEKKNKYDDIEVGTLILPEYFGSAWIVDGQHRLYGVAKAESDVVVPVLAFESIDQIEQANLFVDINEKQTSVPKNLLWDLYSDIYRNSTDEKQKLKFQLAETAKKLEASGPLKGYIDIPSIPATRPVKLTLTTVCSTIEKYLPWDLIKHPIDDSKTPDNAHRLISAYFEVLKELWPEDWAKGNKGVMLSNIGFGVFIMVYHDILKHIDYKQKTLLQENKTHEFKKLIMNIYLRPMIELLKTDEKMQKNIRSQTGRGPQNSNAAFLDLQIQEFIIDFNPTRLGGEPLVPKEQKPPAVPKIEEKARLAEGKLRYFVMVHLKRYYGSNKWWKRGIPGGQKRKAIELWEGEVRRKPQPHLKQVRDPESWFEFLALGDLIDIVIYRDNWDNIFYTIFSDKNNFKRRILDIIVLRNPSTHGRKPDDQDIADGQSGLLWLSQCLSDQDLNPYT